MKLYLVLAIIAVAIGVLFTTDLSGTNPDILILSESTTVSLNVPITQDSVKNLQVELMDKSQKLSAKQHIVLTLNSPGGSIDAGFKLIETAQGLRQEVDTLSLFSASMSFITSQYLGKRYATPTSTLMSHRAYLGGVEGQIPGSFMTRTNFILDSLVKVDLAVSKRASLSLDAYQKAIANELWMDGNKALELRYADKVVNVRCDKTLQGAGAVQKFQVMMFTVNITYHKCPLVTEPIAFEVSGTMNAEADYIWQMYLNDKPKFIEEYIVNGKFNRYVK